MKNSVFSPEVQGILVSFELCARKLLLVNPTKYAVLQRRLIIGLGLFRVNLYDYSSGW